MVESSCEIFANFCIAFVSSSNVRANKKCSGRVKCYNKDARQFIREEVRESLLEIWSSNPDNIDNAHIVMNLPALAITFVSVFRGLVSDR